MTRTAQILVLFLFAVYAAQGASSNRRSYIYGRSHGRHHDPRDYRYSSHRSRHGGDYGRRPGSHAKLHGSSTELDGSTPYPAFEASANLDEPAIHIGAKEGEEHQNTISVNGKLPGNDGSPDDGTINVAGALPEGASADKLFSIGDNIHNPDGLIENKPNNDGNNIKVDGLNPNKFDESNPIHGDATVSGSLSTGNDDILSKNYHLLPVDGLKPGNVHISNINPGTININGKSPNEGIYKPGEHNGSNNVNGLLPNENDIPNHDNLSNEDRHQPGNNNSNVSVGDLPSDQGKSNVGKQPNVDGSVGIGPKEELSNSHNTINVAGLTPEYGNRQPSNMIYDNITEKPVHPINPHDSFPGAKETQPKHDHSNVNGLLPGGEGSNSDHGIGFEGGLTTSGKPNHDNVEELKPTSHQPDTNLLNNNGLPAGAGAGVHIKLPDQMKPVRPDGSITGSVSLPDLSGLNNNNNGHSSGEKPGYGGYGQPTKPINYIPGNIGIPGVRVDNAAGGNKANKSFVLPVYLPGANGQVVFPSGVMPQNGKVPAFYVVMIDGHATLVRNPAAGLTDIDDGKDINSILGQDSGIGGIAISSLSNLNGLAGISGAGLGLLQQPFVIGNRLPGGSVILGGLMPNGNMPSFISGEPSVNIEPVVSEQIQPPVITETVPVPQPIYPMPVPATLNPGSFVYPNMPYPYPYPSMWDNNRNPNMNWPNIIDFFINLGAHMKYHNISHLEDGKGQHKPDGHHGGSGQDNKSGGNNNGGSAKTVGPKKPDHVNISGEKIEDESNRDKNGSGTDQPIPNKHDSKKPNDSGSGNSHGKQPDNSHETTSSTDNPTPKVTSTEPATKPSESPVTRHESKLPDHTNIPFTPTVTEHIFTKGTPKPTVTKNTPLPDFTKPTPVVTLAQTPATEGHLHDDYTESPNHKDNSGNEGGDGTKINGDKDPVPIYPTSTNKPGSDNNLHITIPSKPGFNNEESKITSGPYDPTLINLLNVVLKLPNKGSLPKAKPTKENDDLKKILEAIQKQKPGDNNNNNFVSNQHPNADDKTLKELLELLKSKPGDKGIKDLFEHLKGNPDDKDIKNLLEILKSKPGDKYIKDLLEILKSKPEDKALRELLAILKSHGADKKPSLHEILALLGRNEDKNEPNPAIFYQILLHLLNDYNRQPNAILVEQPGMDEATRSNLILLLNLLASNLGSEYSSGLGFGGGYYEQINPANLYFLGHFPCDFSNINAAAGEQGFGRGLWQLLSRMNGYRSSVNPLSGIRLERSAEEEDDAKHLPAKN